MDTDELKELLASVCEDSLDDLDEVENLKKCIRLTFMSGDQFEVTVRSLNEDDDDDDVDDESGDVD